MPSSATCPKWACRCSCMDFRLILVIYLLYSVVLKSTFGFIFNNGKYAHLHSRGYSPPFRELGNCRNTNGKILLATQAENSDIPAEPVNYGGESQTAIDSPQSQFGSIKDLELCDELGSSFMKYALSIILGRALPDARDGLKVVHRRILWAMQDLKLGYNAPFRKCAKVVGDVLGKYHPHSDKSVYDALCRLSQQFVMRVSLVDGHGNFGSADDPPAAMRYTECRLTRFSEELMLTDLDCQTVDMLPNFDSTEIEPSVLPSKVPTLLINGSSGIAVALSTNIPPHNPDEVISAAILMARHHGNVTNEQLLQIIKGPDFPTGGIINSSLDALSKIYTSGKGSICVEAKFHFEERNKSNKDGPQPTLSVSTPNQLAFAHSSRISIVVTEIPYNVKLSDIIRAITKGVESGIFNGISDLRDESDRDGIRLVIELKRQVTSPIEVDEIVKQLKNHTGLRSYFKCNFIALDENGKKPIRFTLLQALQIWLNFRVDTIKKRIKFHLSKAKNRLVIVKGFIIACELIDDIIKMIKTCTSMQEIRHNLADKKYGGLNTEQANAVLKMTLSQLSKLESESFIKERNKLTLAIEDYKKTLANEPLIYKIIERELVKIRHDGKQFYGLNRRLTALSDQATRPAAISIEALVTSLQKKPNGEDQATSKNGNSSNSAESSLVVMNNSGWMQRIKLDKSFYASARSRSIYSPRIYEPPPALHSVNNETLNVQDEHVKLNYAVCSPGHQAFVVNSEGICVHFNISKLRLCKRGYSMWKSIGMEVKGDIQVFFTADLDSYDLDESFLIIGFANGELAIYRANVLASRRNKSQVTKVRLWKPPRDVVTFALLANDEDDIFLCKLYVDNNTYSLATTMGNSIRLKIQDVTQNMDNRSKKRIKAIGLRDGDIMTSGTLLRDSSDPEHQNLVLLLSQQGKGKLMESDELRVQRHGGRGYNVQRRVGDDPNDPLVSGVSITQDQQVLIVTANGQLARKNPFTLRPGSRHHKMKNFWIRPNDTDDVIQFAASI